MPTLEAVGNGLQIFTVTATFGALLFLYYFLRNDQANVGRTLLTCTALILPTYCLAYFLLGVYGA